MRAQTTPRRTVRSSPVFCRFKGTRTWFADGLPTPAAAVVFLGAGPLAIVVGVPFVVGVHVAIVPGHGVAGLRIAHDTAVHAGGVAGVSIAHHAFLAGPVHPRARVVTRTLSARRVITAVNITNRP